MRLLDRYLLFTFLRTYAVCFVCFLALCLVIDLFAQIDEFTKANEFTGQRQGGAALARNIADYYLYRVPWFFQRLGSIFSLSAAMFTFAWMERQNELTPILAAGIPMRRLLGPVLAGVIAVVGLSLANREFLIPHCAPYLERKPADLEGLKSRGVPGVYDSNLVHVEGLLASPPEQLVQCAKVTLPPSVAGGLTCLECSQMYYRPAQGETTGGWYLVGVVPEHIETPHPTLNWLRPGVYFLHSDLSFQQLVRNPSWFQYASTANLIQLLQRSRPCERRAEVLALFHRRLTEPLVEVILVLLGVGLILGRSDQGIFLKMGLCLMIFAAFQGLQYLCNSLASKEHLDPLLAAWLPVLSFGPLAVAWLEGMRS